jgi:hypothetical protein
MVLRLLLVALLIVVTLPQVTWGQSQLTPADLEQAISGAARTRANNLDQVRGFFGKDYVQTALKSARIDPNQVEKAVSTLSADELSRLASRTQAIQSDFAAGALTNQELTYVIIALGAAVLVLIVVAA